SRGAACPDPPESISLPRVARRIPTRFRAWPKKEARAIEMTLADTSIWRRHLRQSLTSFQALLDSEEVGVHPFVTGELACGNLQNRDVILFSLGILEQAPIAPEIDVRHVLDSHRLWGTGLSWIDVHLLTSAAMIGWRIYSADKAMIAAATRMKLDYLSD